MPKKLKPKASSVKLAPFVMNVADRFPGIWDAYQALGDAAAQAGPLSKRDQRIVKLALAIGAGSEGATHSHARRGISEGVTEPEMVHVAMLAITSLGWSQAMRGLAWVEDVTAKGSRRQSRSASRSKPARSRKRQ